MSVEQALQALASELEKHFSEAAGNKFKTTRQAETGAVCHSIADAISKLIDEKLAERRSAGHE